MSKTSKISLVDVVYQQIRDKILKGIYLPGTRLVEADLVDEHNVSRVTVREALRRLASEGLVDLMPNKGIKVRQLTRKEFHDLLIVRAQLEGLSAKLTAEMDTVDLNPLIRIHDQERDLLSKLEWDFNDGMKKTELNQMFHDTIALLNGNNSLRKILALLRAQIYICEYQFLRSSPRSLFIDSFIFHDDILAAIREHRSEDAFQLAQNHATGGEKFADYYFATS